MKKGINKITPAFILSMITAAWIGVSYASWTDSISIQGTVDTGTVKWEFSGVPSQSDLGLDWNCFWDLESGYHVLMDKDVASTIVKYEDPEHPHVMTVTINNAYPYYYNHISFNVHYYGSIPARIWKVNFIVDSKIKKTIYKSDEYIYLDLNGDGQNDIEIWWGDGFGKQLHYCSKHATGFDILVLQPAPQGKTLNFQIELVCIQWNEYTTPNL